MESILHMLIVHGNSNIPSPLSPSSQTRYRENKNARRLIMKQSTRQYSYVKSPHSERLVPGLVSTM